MEHTFRLCLNSTETLAAGPPNCTTDVIALMQGSSASKIAQSGRPADDEIGMGTSTDRHLFALSTAVCDNTNEVLEFVRR